MGVILVIGVLGFAAYALQDQVSGALGGNLTADEITQLASNAGFSGWDLQTAVAVAFAESSGNPNAVGDITLGGSIGLWQIYLKAHPEYTRDELFDPQTNANAAYAIYQAAGNQFTPWSTYNNAFKSPQAKPNYQSHLDSNGNAVA